MNKFKKKYITLINPYCKYNCLHCCYNTKTKVKNKEVKKTIINLQKKGYIVNLYELYPTNESLELFEITKQFNKNKGYFDWLNITNDFEFTKENINFLKKIKATIHYSIFGCSKKTNAEITCDKNYLEKTLRHIKKLKRIIGRKEISFFMILHKKNIDEIPKIIRICEIMRINELDITYLTYINKARSKRFSDYYLTEKDIQKFLKICIKEKKRTKVDISIDKTCGPILTGGFCSRNCNIWAPPIKKYFCGQTRNQYTIMLGSNLVFPCASMAGDEKLSIGRYDNKKMIIEKKWPLNYKNIEEPCKSCERFNECKGGCRADAIFDELEKKRAYNFNAGQKRCLYYNSKNLD